MNEGFSRRRMANAMLGLALVSLLCSVGYTAYMWVYAWQHYLYPRIPAMPLMRAWYTVEALGRASDYAFGMSLAAFATALLSLLFKPDKKAAATLLLSLIMAVVVVCHMFTLIIR